MRTYAIVLVQCLGATPGVRDQLHLSGVGMHVCLMLQDRHPLLQPSIPCQHEGCPLLLTLGWVIKALQLDTALCCCRLASTCGGCGLMCWQRDDGHLVQRGLEGVEQPAVEVGGGGVVVHTQGHTMCLSVCVSCVLVPVREWPWGCIVCLQQNCLLLVVEDWSAAGVQYACSTHCCNRTRHRRWSALPPADGPGGQRRKGDPDSLVEL